MACIGILIAFYFQKFFKKIFILIIPPLFILLLGILNIPFVKSKFQEVNESRYEVQLENAAEGYQVMPQRFDALLMAWKDFVNNPFLGYGGMSHYSWIPANVDFHLQSGLGAIMIQFGLFGLILIFYQLFRAGNFYAQVFTSNPLPFILIIIAITISYEFILEPFFMVFYLMPYFITFSQVNDFSNKQLKYKFK
jgi:hypothetical protein